MLLTLSTPRIVSFDATIIEETIAKAFIASHSDYLQSRKSQLEHEYANAENDEIRECLEDMLIAIENDNYAAFQFYEKLLMSLQSCVDDLQTNFVPVHTFPYGKSELKRSPDKERLKALSTRGAQSSQRISQSDLKSIALDASMPVPPTMIKKGGQLHAQWIGV